MISSKAYNVLKPVALVWLPALGTLYFALSQVWGLPDSSQVVGTITAIDTFLGVGLHVSTTSYKGKKATDGNLVIDKSDPDKDTYCLEVTTPFSEIDSKDAITLRVMQKA